MTRIELSDEETERIKKIVPATVKHRQLVIQEIVEELKRRGFKELYEGSYEDLNKIVKIVSELHPENNPRTIKNYAETAIRLWRKEKGI